MELHGLWYTNCNSDYNGDYNRDSALQKVIKKKKRKLVLRSISAKEKGGRGIPGSC